MRPVRYDAEVGGGDLMEKRSLDLEHAEEAWDQWEIHCLILVSLSLQVFLSLTADLRRRSASCVLSTVLWLAYLSADAVAVFVLGHLAVHAQGPGHELMLFWAPFVLVHLGGQDTITAFSKQDNELWTRHLLGLVTQTAVAGYVVSQSSWPDARLRASMMLIFLCGFLKYVGRTCCLYAASPKSLRGTSMDSLSLTLRSLQEEQNRAVRPSHSEAKPMRNEGLKARYKDMFLQGSCWKMEFISELSIFGEVDDTMLFDAPVDDWEITKAADELPDLLKEYKHRPDRCTAYEYVAASLGNSYRLLYTKAPVPKFRMYAWGIIDSMFGFVSGLLLFPCLAVIISILFQYALTTIALVLFAYAPKEGHHSKADITVSYILLVGAIILDLQPALTSVITSCARKAFPARTVCDCVELCLTTHPLAYRHTRKHWSEELAQYSMTRRYASVQGHYAYACLPSFWDWINKHKPFEVTRAPVCDDLKLFILDKLLLLQTRKQDWDIASFHGERAVGKWMDSHQVPEPERSSYTLYKSISSRVEFAASVLIWHIATDICYFFSVDNAYSETDEIKKRKKMSRELSHYIMYLVFKCDVMLTSNSRLAHKKTHEQLTKYFPQVHLDEKKTVIRMFEAMKKEATKEEKQQQGSMQGAAQDKKNEEIANEDAAATTSGSGAQERLQMAVEAIYTPLLPVAREVVQELIDKVADEADRWELISEVWLEMLFYTAPRCGAAFHYEHLATGGEFITHVLFLMRSLGPFMPKPKSGA